jgi:molybdopterin converting factor small subunit
MWVNGEPVPPSCVLCAGDEVAVLPPVSGGAG